jgi:hypothetical protein
MNPSPQQIVKLMVKPILVSVLIVSVLVGLFVVLVIVSAPKINYSVKTADCTATQLARSSRCNIVITAANPTNKTQDVNWDGLGFGVWNPLVKIYDNNGSYCYGFVDPPERIPPYQARELKIGCAGNNISRKKYDKHADTHPAYVYIDGSYFLDGTKLVLNPKH